MRKIRQMKKKKRNKNWKDANDPLGSWTGTSTLDQFPVQDADDL